MHGFRRIMNGDEPAVEQAVVNGHALTWNPDDSRYYVHATHAASDVMATFKEFRNAVYFAKTH